MTHIVEVSGIEVSVRLIKIAHEVFEAVGKSNGTDFFIRGTTPESALARFKVMAERHAAEQAAKTDSASSS